MKNQGSILMGFVTLLFFSCSDTQEINQEQGQVKQGEPALLSVRLAGGGNAVSGKAVGTPTADEESQVNDGIVYIFNANGEVLNKSYFEAGDITGSSGSKEIQTTTEAASVSVLLNTGISDSAGIVGTPYDIVTKNQLEALTVNLALSNGQGAGIQVMDNLMMSGTTSGPIVYTGMPKTADVAVTVYRIVSKVTINWSFEPNSAYVNKIRLVGAVVLNVPLTSKLFGTSLITPNPMYLEGLPDSVLTAFPAGGYKPANQNMISNVDLLSVSNFQVSPVPANHFYIFENGNVCPTIVALVADFNENGIDLPAPANNLRKYYPVVINKATSGNQDGTMTIKRNVSFNVNAIVKGVGVDNPFNPIDPASLNITLTVADWALIVNVNQTFE